VIVEENSKKCLGCDNLIKVPSKKNYCSDDCYSRVYKKQYYLDNKIITLKEERSCECCSKIFIPKTKKSRYCSSKCGNKDFQRKVSGFYNIKPRNCGYCGNLFTPKKGKNTKCCSGKCNSKLYAKNNPEKCRETKRNTTKKRKAKNPELFLEKKRMEGKRNQKWTYIKRKYGLTKEEYFNLIESQNNRCKICNNILEGRDTHVDHCHTTGRVRGILCFNCNVGLGNFKDSIQFLYNAIHYLEQNK